MNRRSPSLLTAAVLLYAALNSMNLIQGWRTAPYENLSWLMLIIWCLPIIYFWSFLRKGYQDNFVLLSLAITFSFLGLIGSLNAFKYFGFALALAALVPWSWHLLIWLFCSLAWMPIFGWLGSYFFGNNIALVRSIVIIFGSGYAIYVLAKGKK